MIVELTSLKPKGIHEGVSVGVRFLHEDLSKPAVSSLDEVLLYMWIVSVPMYFSLFMGSDSRLECKKVP